MSYYCICSLANGYWKVEHNSKGDNIIPNHSAIFLLPLFYHQRNANLVKYPYLLPKIVLPNEKILKGQIDYIDRHKQKSQTQSRNLKLRFELHENVSLWMIKSEWIPSSITLPLIRICDTVSIWFQIHTDMLLKECQEGNFEVYCMYVVKLVLNSYGAFDLTFKNPSRSFSSPTVVHQSTPSRYMYTSLLIIYMPISLSKEEQWCVSSPNLSSTIY